jgi:integrase
MEPDEKNQDPSPDSAQAVDPEEAKRLAMRKRKPLGPVVKPLTEEQIEALLKDPESAERDGLLDAMPKGWDADNQDSF